MAKKNAQPTDSILPPLLPKVPSSIEVHESLYWLEKERTLHIMIAYNEEKTQEETATYMAILIGRIAEYGPWTNIIRILFHPRLVRRWQLSSIYTQHVSEMKALVKQINQSFKVLEPIDVRLEIDYANFQQMKLAACFFDLEATWNLCYFVEGEACLKKIGDESHLMKRLRGIYGRDFE